MKITKVTIETDEGVTLIAEGTAVQQYEIEWLADIIVENKLGVVHKKATGRGQYRIRLELACAGYKPSKPRPPMIE